MSNTHLDKLFASLPTHLEVQDVAQVLGRSKTAVYELLKSGAIPAYKVGGSWIILRDELREMLEKSSNQSPPS